jgi:hypothetical protein
MKPPVSAAYPPGAVFDKLYAYRPDQRDRGRTRAMARHWGSILPKPGSASIACRC